MNKNTPAYNQQDSGKPAAENNTGQHDLGFGSAHAGSLGGKARAKRLTKEAKSDIARKGAAVRWAAKDDGNLPKALCGGREPLRLGKVEIPCYVLEDGAAKRDEDRRVITVSGLQQAL